MRWFKKPTGKPASTELQVAAATFVRRHIESDPERQHGTEHLFMRCKLGGVSVGSWKITVEPIEEGEGA